MPEWVTFRLETLTSEPNSLVVNTPLPLVYPTE